MLAIALVKTRSLRPTFMPAFVGQDFILSGYRVFVRVSEPTGKGRRGLRILRSDTNRRLMVCFGNLLTHYNYRRARIRFEVERNNIEVETATPGAEADLHVIADLASRPAPLPPGSPFATLADARRYAGPLPYTFDYEKPTHSLIMIRGVRANWNPQPIAVRVLRNSFLERPPLADCQPIFASAFHVQDIPYRWDKGVQVELGDGKQ